jgi:hypothetical protein
MLARETSSASGAWSVQGPAAICAQDVQLCTNAVLGDQQILFQARQLAVEGEFFAAVVGLTRVGEDLDDEAWIKEHIAAVVQQPRLAAQRNQVRIFTRVSGGDQHLHVISDHEPHPARVREWPIEKAYFRRRASANHAALRAGRR